MTGGGTVVAEKEACFFCNGSGQQWAKRVHSGGKGSFAFLGHNIHYVVSEESGGQVVGYTDEQNLAHQSDPSKFVAQDTDRRYCAQGATLDEALLRLGQTVAMNEWYRSQPRPEMPESFRSSVYAASIENLE